MSKQNVGLLAIAATVVAVWSTFGRRALLKAVVPATAGFTSMVAVMLLPIALGGGLPGLWEYGFAAKGAYVSLGNVSYFASLGSWFSVLPLAFSRGNLSELVHGGPVLILPVSCALLAIRRPRIVTGPERVVLIFAAAAVFTAFPRWDRFHMGYAVPVLLLALIVLLQSRPPMSGRRRTWTSAPAWVLAAVCFGSVVARPVVVLADPSRRPARLPHFRGPMVDVDAPQAYIEAAGRLVDAAGDRPLFILSGDAGFWYLLTGLENPTPFGIPTSTSVGRSGEAWLVDELRSGTLSAVCLKNELPGRLGLTNLERFVLDRLEKGPDVGPCTVYRVPGRPEGPRQTGR